MKPIRPFKPHTVPRFGVSAGGPLDGWNFTFYRVVVSQQRALIEVFAQPPKWPFPSRKPVRLQPGDFAKLLADPRAPFTDTRTHLLAALAAEQKQ